MAAANLFRYAYRAYLSRPKSARQLYRLVRLHKASRIMEIGISDVDRTIALVEVAQRYAEGKPVRHTGLDSFDARPAGMIPLTLKDAYRLLHATSAAVRLVPGPPASALAAVANAHPSTDLILISPAVSDEELQAAWFYVPRMLHHQSVILRERRTDTEPTFEWLTHSQIAEWAGRFGSRRAA